MSKIISLLALSTLFPLIGALGCGSEAGVSPEQGPPSSGLAQPPGNTADPALPGSVLVQLVDGPLDRFKEVNIEVQKVEINDAMGGWTEIGAPNKIINLLALRDGASEHLGSAQLSAGSYPGVRFMLGMNNSVRLADDSTHPLKVPSAQQSGIKVMFDLNVQDGDSKELFLDFDVAESIHMVAAGHSNQFLLRPLLHAVEKTQSGTISGRLSDSISGEPLADAVVYAETRDAQGQPLIVRRVLSNSEGKYKLDLLPLGSDYVVVSQPLVSGAAYEAKASAPLPLRALAASATFDAQFTPSLAVGSMQVQVTPMASEQQGDTCFLLQGDGSSAVIVRSDVTIQDGQEQVQFEQLPAGSYSVQCVRRSTASQAASQLAPVAVGAAMTRSVQVSF